MEYNYFGVCPRTKREIFKDVDEFGNIQEVERELKDFEIYFFDSPEVEETDYGVLVKLDKSKGKDYRCFILDENGAKKFERNSARLLSIGFRRDRGDYFGSVECIYEADRKFGLNLEGVINLG